MSLRDVRTVLVWVIVVAALACGIIGLVVGILDKEWKLGIIGWFTGGTLLAVIRMAILADEFLEARRRDHER